MIHDVFLLDFSPCPSLQLEGGGQVLRLTTCLSALMHTGVEIGKIRAGRPKPGLSAQHLAGIKLVSEM